jgi:hypothetical protein
MQLGLNAWSLGVEASSVIGLRTLKIAAGGPDGDAEGRRMVDEKVSAALEWQALMLSGGLGATPAGAAARTLAHYRRKVRANRKRLSR